MNLANVIKMMRQKAFYKQKDFSIKLNVVKPNVKAIKLIKAFYEENKLDYKIIEND